MEPQAENKIRRFTQNQARILEVLLESPANAGTAALGDWIKLDSGETMSGKQFGAVVSGLQKAGVVQPLGRDGRNVRWEVTDSDINQAWQTDHDGVKGLIKRITK